MEGTRTRTCYLDVPGFEQDVFISYTHLDNEPDLPGEEGWIDTFHYSLEQRLRKLLGCKEVGVWRDKEKGIRGNDEFADKLIEVLAKVGVLVSIISPAYKNSPWCLRELREFIENASRSGEMTRRVFPVIKEEVKPEERPPEVQGKTGYEFLWRSRPITLRSQEEKVEFAERIEELARDIKELLESFREAEGPMAQSAPEWSGTVYLAETTPDLLDARERMRRALLERNYRVVPEKDSPLPAAKEIFYDTVKAYLRECDLSIHMIGAEYGARPEGERRCMARLQYELAGDLERSTEILETRTIEELKTHVFDDRLGNDRGIRPASGTVKHIIWIPQGVRPTDERQATFLERLRNGAGMQRSANRSGTSTAAEQSGTDEPPTAEEISAQPGASQPSVGQASEGGARSVYLICDARDLDAIKPLSDLLFDGGLEIELPAFAQVGDGTMSEEQARAEQDRVLAEHKKKLSRCNAFLVYYGTGSDAWFDSNFDELRRLPGLGREDAVRAVYLGPPETSRKQLFKTREALILKDLGDLQTLLDAVPPGNGAS